MSKEASHPGRTSSGAGDRRVVCGTDHDWDGREPVSDVVVRAVANAAGVAPTELSEPLNESVDPDALDAIFSPRHDGTPRPDDSWIEFPTNGYVVVVRGDGQVAVYESADA